MTIGGDADVGGVGDRDGDGVAQRVGVGVNSDAVPVVQVENLGVARHALRQGIIGVVVEKDLVRHPDRLIGGSHGDRVGQHGGDDALVVHIHQGRKQGHHVGDDDALGGGLLLVLQGQGDVEIGALGRQGIEAVQLDVPVPVEPGSHLGFDVHRVAGDVPTSFGEGVNIGRLGGAHGGPTAGHGVGQRAGHVLEGSDAGGDGSRVPDDGRPRRVGDQAGRWRDYVAEADREPGPHRLGDGHVRRIQVPVVPHLGSHPHRDVGLVGWDDVVRHGWGELLLDAATHAAALAHAQQNRVEGQGVGALADRRVGVGQDDLAVFAAGKEDGRGVGPGGVRVRGDDGDADRGREHRVVQDVGLWGQPGEGQRTVGVIHAQVGHVVERGLVGQAVVQVHRAGDYQAGRFHQVAAVALGVERAASGHPIGDSRQPVRPQRVRHVVGVTDGYGRQDEDVVIGQVAGDDVRLTHGFKIVAPEVDAEQGLEGGLLPGNDLVGRVADIAVEQSDIGWIEDVGASHGVSAVGVSAVVVAIEATQAHLGAGRVGDGVGRGCGSPGHRLPAVGVEEVLVGVAELRLVGAQGNQGGTGWIQLARAGPDEDRRRTAVVSGIAILYGTGDGSGIDKAVAGGLRRADHAGDGDDAPFPRCQVCHLPGVTDAAGGGDERAAADATDVGDSDGHHVGDDHGGGDGGAGVGEDQGIGDGLPCEHHLR